MSRCCCWQPHHIPRTNRHPPLSPPPMETPASLSVPCDRTMGGRESPSLWGPTISTSTSRKGSSIITMWPSHRTNVPDASTGRLLLNSSGGGSLTVDRSRCQWLVNMLLTIDSTTGHWQQTVQQVTDSRQFNKSLTVHSTTGYWQ